jgi:hypothetical protein
MLIVRLQKKIDAVRFPGDERDIDRDALGFAAHTST